MLSNAIMRQLHQLTINDKVLSIMDDTLAMNKRLTIEIDPELKEKLMTKLRTEGYTLKGIVSKWVREYLKK